MSAAGYYADAYDFAALAEYVLRPLGPGGDRRVRPCFHDLESDQPIDAEPIPVPAAALVIIDGTFLLRAELDGLWDEMIYIDTDSRIARARAVQRDAALFGGPRRSSGFTARATTRRARCTRRPPSRSSAPGSSSTTTT
jgi:uridine kinase